MPAATLLALCLRLQDLGGATWIWGRAADALERPAGETCELRRELELAAAPDSAVLVLSADDAALVRVNGVRAARTDAWQNATAIDVAELLTAGANAIEITARNAGGPAGVVAALELEVRGARIRVVSDTAWSGRCGEEAWGPARAIAPFGAAPWGDVPVGRRVAGARGLADRFDAPPGFRVDEAWSGLGSYLALALDGEGRVYVSSEDGGVLALDDTDGDGVFERERVYTDRVTGCQGLAWKDGALFCVGDGPAGPGLYRVPLAAPLPAPGTARGAARGGAAPELVGAFDGAMGEHGPHAVVVGPDGDLYVAVGNHAGLAAPWSPRSPYARVYEGHLLPPLLDPRGHATDVGAPGGIVARVTLGPEPEWRVVAGGLRNAYDLAFRADGGLFTFDSDMEWDLGLPWYRPVRLLHVVPGGEYGWRTGSAKWPAWYPDALPPACEVGRGSPAGMVAYDGASFPSHYRDALLAADWSRGRILAFFPERDGVSYRASFEELLRGRPLNATDLAVAADGSLLITTGGRGTEGALWRLSYAGDPPGAGVQDPPGKAPAAQPGAARARGDAAGAEQSFAPTAGPQGGSAHGAGAAAGRADGRGLRAALDALAAAGDDRFARFAAARALEAHGVTVADAAGGGDARARAEVLVAAARLGLERADAEDCARGIAAALDAAWSAGTDAHAGEARRIALRALDLFLQDADAPPRDALRDTAEALLTLFPTGDADADAELALLLAHLAPAGAADALAAALAAEPSRAAGVHLLDCLRRIEDGWSDAARSAVADWLARAASGGGLSFDGYLGAIRAELRAAFGPDHADLLLDQATEAQSAHAAAPPIGGEPWSFDATLAFLTEALAAERRSPAEGARVFAASCARCHPFHAPAAGASLGPDLAGVAGRFSRRDLLDAVVRPSRVVPDAYRALDVFLAGGAVASGLVVADRADALVLARSDGTRVELDPAEVAERRPSAVSIMPDGLLAALTLEEVADLFAYLAADAPTAVGEPEEPEWTPLFDGATLAGWHGDPALWSVAGGVIAGRGVDLPGSSFLVSDAAYGDFVLELDLFVVAGNSGVQLRSTPAGAHGLHGYQADAGERWWGSLYEEGGRGMLHAADPAVWEPAARPGGWNHYAITARGDRIVVELNGAVTADVRDGARAAGHLGLQLHRGTSEIRVRGVRIREL
jgi:putative heme-binding domain-containing protein